MLLHKRGYRVSSAPTGLAPVERGLLHKRGRVSSAPTGLAPVERGLLHKNGRK